MLYENEIKLTKQGGSYYLRIPAEWIKAERIDLNRHKVILSINGNELKLTARRNEV